MPFSFFESVHRIFPTLMALRYDFSDSTRRIAVLFLTSNMLVNKHSDLLVHGFFTVVWVMRKLGMTALTKSGV